MYGIRCRGRVLAGCPPYRSSTRVARRQQVHQSRLPCHTGILALLVEIDRVVGAWCPHEKTTIDKLRQLTGRGWRPQDCELLDTYSGLVEQWVLTATELLDKRPW